MIVDMHLHNRPGTGAADVPEIREQCRCNGVDHVILCSLGRWTAFPDSAEVREANEEARACAEASDGLIDWLAYLNPQNDDWRQELDHCQTTGAIGIKLWISLRDEKGRLDNTRALIREAAARCLPVLVHTFYRTDPPRPGEIMLDEVGEVARQFPKATLIAAHAGAFWRPSVNILRSFPPNALVDISGCFPERGIVEALVKVMGADRVLFGSDALGRSVASQLAKVEFATLSATARKKILGENAIRVFGLTQISCGGKTKPKTGVRLPDLHTDHFCFCGKWPFFKTAAPTPKALDRSLAAAGIKRAYTADLGSVYQLDLLKANAIFLRLSRETAHVAPLAAVNPRARDWRPTIEALDKTAAGVILHPYLHNWRLDDPACADCLAALVKTRLPIWINTQLGDHRFRHSGLSCRPVTTDELIAFALAYPSIAAVVQGATAPQITAFMERIPGGQYRFEISKLTDQSGLFATAVRAFGVKPFVMGSEYPLRDLSEVRWVLQREKLIQ